MNIRGYRPRLYGIWLKMRGRCNTATDGNYPDYGGRGISVCQEWDSYESFHKWATANGYSDDLSLDRIDNDGNYHPANCRWATHKQQARNTRRNILVSCGGETLPLVVWAERTGLHYARLHSRVKMGWSDGEVLGIVPRPLRFPKRRGAKLTDADALAISKSEASGIELADRYGVSPSLISRIRHGLTWTRVTQARNG